MSTSEAATEIPRVLLDTNIIVASPRLNSGAWRALLSAARSQRVALFVPEVCIIETVGWVRREAPLRLDRFAKAAAQLGHLGVDPSQGQGWLAAAESETAKMSADYDAYLRGRLEGAATILTVPDVSHEALVQRAVDRVRPFTERGTGYRDALIWESVCELAKEAPITLLTANLKDFASGNALADDLTRDLGSRGIPAERVELATELVALVQRLLPFGHDVRSEIELVLATQAGRGSLVADMNEAFGQMGSLPYPTHGDDLPSLFENPEAEGVWDAGEVAVHEAQPTGDDSYFITGSLRAVTRVYDVIDEDVWRKAKHEERSAVEDAWDRGHGEVTIVAFRPVIITFAGTYTPPSSIWNVGVLDVALPEQSHA